MMNREEALQWLVDNVKEWPTSWPKTKLLKKDGWEWFKEVKVGLYGEGIFSFCNIKIPQNNTINREDWIAAKQSAPLTRDQALAWLVENVKVWPNEFSDLILSLIHI